MFPNGTVALLTWNVISKGEIAEVQTIVSNDFPAFLRSRRMPDKLKGIQK